MKRTGSCKSSSRSGLGNRSTGLGAGVLIAMLMIGVAMPSWAQRNELQIGGLVVDALGAAIRGAAVTLGRGLSQGQIALTDETGGFRFDRLGAGSYVVTVEAPGFETEEMELRLPGASGELFRIVLDPARLNSVVTVTANRGLASTTAEIPQIVSVRDERYMAERPAATIGNVLEDSVGVEVQQTTYGQVSPILRGLTGYHVLNLVDGIRYNNSIFRSGPNQYLAFVPSRQSDRIETVLGPAGAQHGSDSLGGTINVLTAEVPRMESNWTPHFELGGAANSADLSAEGYTELSVAGRNVAWLGGVSGRKLNDLRSGRGEDSRNVFRRYFDLNASRVKDLYGTRLQDSGFRQQGAYTKFVIRPTADQTWTLSYQRSDQDGVRQYRNLFGGRARQHADMEPESLQFFYARYENTDIAVFDSVSGTFSVNSQRTGSTLQNEGVADTIVTERNGVDMFGYSGQASTHFASSGILIFGGDVYNEHIGASRFDTDPRTEVRSQVRPLYPDGSRYTTYAAFAEQSTELVDGRVRVVVGGRLTNVRVRTFADRDPFGVIDSSQSFSDVSFNAAVGWRVFEDWRANFVVSRGFRAPNMNDLGAIGLNSLGYEIPSSEAAPFGALIGTSAGEDAVSTGRAAGSLVPENVYNYEIGVGYNNGRFEGRVQLFDSEFYNPIVRTTLLFPAERLPEAVAGVGVTPNPQTPAQRAQGVVTLGATGIDPLGLKAFVNDGRARYYGLESTFRLKATSTLGLEANYSFLAGRQLNPNRNARRLVPQMGVLKVRYTPAGSFWLELAGRFAGPQKRLSGGDLSDERIGQARSRRDIATVFNGAVITPWIDSGEDGIRGTADDRFTPTGETLLQIQDRILPIGTRINGVRVLGDRDRVPVFDRAPGWFAADVLAGLDLNDRTALNLAATNILDRNYRVYGSGVDAPGISLYAGLRYSF